MTNSEFPSRRDSTLRLSVGVGVGVFAGLILFAAVERYREQRAIEQGLQMLQRTFEVANAEGRKAEAAREEFRLRQQLAAAERDQLRAARARAEKEAAEAAADRTRREGRYFPTAASSMSEGEYACSNERRIVRRTADGWQQAVRGDGSAELCRTVP